MTAIGTYWRTLRHLKGRQIAGRIVFRLGARPPAFRSAPPLRDPAGAWVLPARRLQSLIGPEEFRFLNRERALDQGGWDPPGEEKLWRYNLHYFDDLNASGAEERRGWHAALVRRWIRENPPARGTGWEPYPTSLRIVNWIKWSLGGAIAEAACIESIAMQARWLSRRIEWHLLGNHLFVNAKALVFAGLFFRGSEADRWRVLGVRILGRELREQVLADGAQFERTPMYHVLALEDVLDVLSCIKYFGCPEEETAGLEVLLRECAARMWWWAEVMQFSDGSMPRFNDCADGVAPPYTEIVRVARALSLPEPAPADAPIQLLADSGYIRLLWGGARAFLDVGAIGPDYLPGHAHADTLSFELEVHGRLLVLNRGTSCYGLSARRSYERSTAAHSTVEVMGQSSSETWGGFRVGRRARPHELRVSPESVSCAHDGYRFLPGRPDHRRIWTMLPRGLMVEDVVSGGQDAVARYHLAPGLRAQEVAAGVWRVLGPSGQVASMDIRAAWVRMAAGEHALGFGRLVEAHTLEVGLDAGRATACWTW